MNPFKRHQTKPDNCLCGYPVDARQQSSGYTICCAAGDTCIVGAPSVTGWGRPDTVRLWNRRIKQLKRDPEMIGILATHVSILRGKVFELEQQRKAGKP